MSFNLFLCPIIRNNLAVLYKMKVYICSHIKLCFTILFLKELYFSFPETSLTKKKWLKAENFSETMVNNLEAILL